MKTFILTAILSAFFSITFASPLVVKFQVVDAYGNMLKKTKVNVYKGNYLISSEISKSNKVKVDLKSDARYTIEVKLDGFITKRVVINTNTYDQEPEESNYKFFVELERTEVYADMPNADQFFDYPAAIIEFDSELGNFDFNRSYGISSKYHRNEIVSEAIAASDQ